MNKQNTMKGLVLLLMLCFGIILKLNAQQVINNDLTVNGNVISNNFNVSSLNIETVSGQYDPTKISYQFFEGRGLNYNLADDCIYFAMHECVPMVIDNSGFIGIGELNPYRSLVINGTNADNLVIKRSGGTDQNNSIKFENSNQSIYIGAASNNDFAISFDPDLNLKAKLRISNTGNVTVNGSLYSDFFNVSSSQIETVSGNYDPTKISYRFYEGRGLNYNSADDCIYFAMNEGVPMVIDNSGKVGIGVLPTDMVGDSKLFVNGTILATEMKIKLKSQWSDYVFHKDYNLMPISELEQFVTQNKHLPDIPTEKEVKKDGVTVGEMDSKLLKKVEELTLYMIEVNKRVQALEDENTNLKNKIEALQNQ